MPEANLEADLLLDAGAELGEGPVWDDATGRLLWVDIPAGVVHRLDPDTGSDEPIVLDRPVGAVAPADDGGLVLGVGRGFGLVAPDGRVTYLGDLEPDRGDNRMNDGAVDPTGRFLAGSMAAGAPSGSARLYRLEPDLTTAEVFGGVTTSNGLAWTGDGRTMYYIDTRTGGIDVCAYDPDTGIVGERRRLVDVPPDAGAPDGLALDEEGGLWVALFRGGQVRRYTPDGGLDRVVTVPASLTTSCAFGGPDRDRLYITTATMVLTEQERSAQPHAGGLFVCEPGVRGPATARFAGPTTPPAS